MSARLMGARTVLVVEENAEEAQLLQGALRKARVEHLFRFVYDRQEATAYIKGEAPFADRRAHPFPDVVVLNWSRPTLDRFAFLEWMEGTREGESVQIVVWSEWGCNGYCQTATRGGPTMFVKKTLGSDALRDLMTIISGRRAAPRAAVRHGARAKPWAVAA